MKICINLRMFYVIEVHSIDEQKMKTQLLSILFININRGMIDKLISIILCNISINNMI